MANITAGMVKELRERTGLGMMDCKKALVEAEGDMEKAIEDLRKSSGLKAAKKAGRTAAEGVVITRVADDGSYAVVVEVNSETDFVARDDNFLGFANKITDQAFAGKESDVEKLLASGIEDERQALVQKIGENINLRRIQVVEAPAGGVVDAYVHSNNRIAVLVALSGGNAELARDVAMHVAAVNPMVVRADDVPQEVLDKEREIFTAQAAESGKPAEIIAKMIEGRIRKYVSEITLLEQAFVKDPDQTVGALLKAAGADVVGFVRYEVGEGIEKEVVDFAEEVAAQAAAAKKQ
ncbi:translation elongation factor Ts [Pseudohongiella sp. SYSU M77423]|uniref:translation elongation factor Ts n=1 Tax=unclassified Pseudohongiella TaxID=2629611 RepID=UPI000C96F065|nr:MULTISPECIES: translation elongation factor Ts [unclassified Pseudohongiella]MAY57000.1 elongation factor Ts [Gammaproteobacteria bacterium]MDH7943272.1 translation elongation factor Ts [Pseudohongiella sp. SYSU M77423]MEC8860996.1 translation elongation factor Ts [Pseudomonadota bacterium]HBN16055.1 elongation factor Ts [Pseudohongiella sp.]|tara:strand:- start:864 stop:1745 length:882 start_codon:yes stop_codon:yes gene_type:complete